MSYKQRFWIFALIDSVRIVDLDKKLITLSGYTTEETDIQYTGIRPGEKLVEELLDQNEILRNQVFQHIYIGNSQPIDMELVNQFIRDYPALTNEQLKNQLFMLTDYKKPRAAGMVMEG